MPVITPELRLVEYGLPACRRTSVAWLLPQFGRVALAVVALALALAQARGNYELVPGNLGFYLHPYEYRRTEWTGLRAVSRMSLFFLSKSACMEVRILRCRKSGWAVPDARHAARRKRYAHTVVHAKSREAWARLWAFGYSYRLELGREQLFSTIGLNML